MKKRRVIKSRLAQGRDRGWPRLVVGLILLSLVACFFVRAEPASDKDNWKVKGALAAFHEPDPKVQVKALAKMKNLQSPSFTVPLAQIVEKCSDEKADINVCSVAIVALGSIKGLSENYVTKIASLRKDPRKEIRRAVIEALGEIGGHLDEISEALKDKAEDVYVRKFAVSALGNLNNGNAQIPRQIELLIGELKDEDKAISYYRDVPSALRELKDYTDPYVPSMIAVLDDEKNPPLNRAEALQALSLLGKVPTDEQHRQQIIALLNSRDNDVQAATLTALGWMGEAARESFEPEIKQLLDSNVNKRYVLVALGQIDKSYLDTIIEDLKDQKLASDATGALRDIKEIPEEIRNRIVGLALAPTSGPAVRLSAAHALANIAPQLKDESPNIALLLNDWKDPQVRSYALNALRDMGEDARDQIEAIEEQLGDSDTSVKTAAAQALEELGPLENPEILKILNITYEADRNEAYTYRYQAHYLGGGKKEAEMLIRWLGRSQEDISQNLSKAEVVETLQLLSRNLNFDTNKAYQAIRQDMAKNIASLVQAYSWSSEDLAVLSEAEQSLGNFSEKVIVRSKIEAVKRNQFIAEWAKRIGLVLLIHLLFWATLIWLYPKHPRIQAIFFWNKWVRNIAGLGYVSLALTFIPFLRKRLFAPFKASLEADAALGDFNESVYFEDSDVEDQIFGRKRSIREAIPEIRGFIYLEGESGIGKSMFLRKLVKEARHLIAYLPAEKCSNGVIEAIQEKLQGPASDLDFLKSLIHSKAMDICIDGLNEVDADVRAKIISFAESFSSGNIIIATQPLERKPPNNGKIRFYEMQPLDPELIESFLLKLERDLPLDAVVVGENYKKRCKSYLSDALSHKQEPQVRLLAQRSLSNPMDLTVVAQIIARGETPSLFNLMEQQHQIMVAKYERLNAQQQFPLGTFSETVYQMRLNDEKALPANKFPAEIAVMDEQKMVIKRMFYDGSSSQWIFRHDKIMEFYIAQTFLGADNKKPEEHLDDPRFNGVYYLLATLMHMDEAKALHERLIDYAADSKDHLVSDTFTKLLRTRTKLNQ
jgi:HEAT repeat protein